MPDYTYAPRNDFVIVKVSKIKNVAGLAMPDIAKESEIYHVVAVGPKVEDLKVGDQVIMVGVPNQTIVAVHYSKNLLITRETNVTAVLTERKGGE
jgi:NADPH:quinone reductase-like Zn-dependent oxidoreductase